MWQWHSTLYPSKIHVNNLSCTLPHSVKIQFNWCWKGKKRKQQCVHAWFEFPSTVGLWKELEPELASLEAILVPGHRVDKDDFLSTSLKPSRSVSLAQSCLNSKVSVVWENKSEASELSLETFGSELYKFHLFYSPGNTNLTQPSTCLVGWDLVRLNRLLRCKSYLHPSVCAFSPLTFCPHTLWHFSVRNDLPSPGATMVELQDSQSGQTQGK